MVIFGSNPDALAAQQNRYDAAYAQANEANANALTQANMEQVRMALSQRAAQQQAAQNQAQLNQSENFQAQQAALDRASHLRDIQTEYAAIGGNNAIKQNESDFNNAVKDAMNGAIRPDKDELKTLYPHFNESQIGQLFNIAGNAAVAKVQQSAAFADKSGQPPDPSLLDIAGIPKGTEFEKQAQAIVTSLRAPYEEQYKKGEEAVNLGNTLDKIKADQSAKPVPTTGVPLLSVAGSAAYNFTPFSWVWPSRPAVPASGVIQPSDYATSRLAQFQTALNAATNPKQPLVSIGPGGYQSTVPQNWAPAFQRTATAPVQPAQPAATPAATAPPAQPAPPVAKRVAGQRYQTPKGVYLWTGTGWQV